MSTIGYISTILVALWGVACISRAIYSPLRERVRAGVYAERRRQLRERMHLEVRENPARATERRAAGARGCC
jgi:hypothetical protein